MLFRTIGIYLFFYSHRKLQSRISMECAGIRFCLVRELRIFKYFSFGLVILCDLLFNSYCNCYYMISRLRVFILGYLHALYKSRTVSN